MARLVLVSNRVPAPGQRGQAAGGLAVALHNAAHQRDCLWFGWSGNLTDSETPLAPRITQAGRIAFATIDLADVEYQGYYRGFANGSCGRCCTAESVSLNFAGPSSPHTWR